MNYKGIHTTTKKLVLAVCIWVTFVALVMNTLLFHNPALGLVAFASQLLFTGYGVAMYYKPFQRTYDNWFFSTTSISLLVVLLNIPAVYFFRHSHAISLASVFVVAVLGTVALCISTTTPDTEQITYTDRSGTPWAWLLFIASLVLSALYIYSLSRITLHGEVYHGTIAGVFHMPNILLFLSSLCLFTIFFKKYWHPVFLLGILALFLSGSLVYTFGVKNIFDADGWRHLAIVKSIVAGNVYQPTQLHELLKFNTEKIPNGVFYTTEAVVSDLTQVPAITIQKWFATFLGSFLILFLFSWARIWFKSNAYAGFLTLLLVTFT